jgi:hypothetical protein
MLIDERLLTAVVQQRNLGYEVEVKDCPKWMAPYDRMLIIWATVRETRFVFQALPYCLDTHKFAHENNKS